MVTEGLDRERAAYRAVVWVLMLAFSLTVYGLIIAVLRAVYS
jgi:hypothetical protein